MLARCWQEVAHREDHRSKVKDVSAHVIRTSFIPGGNRLSKRVNDSCIIWRQVNHDIPTSNPLGSLENKLPSPQPPHSHKAEGSANMRITIAAPGRMHQRSSTCSCYHYMRQASSSQRAPTNLVPHRINQAQKADLVARDCASL